MKKNIFISLKIIAGLFFVLASGGEVFAQTNFYNGGTNVTVYPNTIVYVDGHVSNNYGHIHNQGDIYLTGDWTNNEPSGCLDANTGTVILDGASQFIKGTQITTFNNLDCKGYGTKTLKNINTVVGGTTGALSLRSSAFDLNKNTLIVTNQAPSAITRTSGYIISETDPTVGYGKIQWNFGNASNNYIYPFGTLSGTYIPFLYNVTSPGAQSTTGNIAVATYPTVAAANPNNRPLPTGVTDLNDKDGNESAAICADRYWIVDANNYSLNPTSDITFTYRDIEWDESIPGSTNHLEEDSLLAWMWSGTGWHNPASGTLNAGANTVTVSGVNRSAPWTLKSVEPLSVQCGDLSLPNAFSPNNDGHNDLFIIRGLEKCFTKFSFIIFDRWGEKVFESEDVSRGWDGTYNGKPMNAAVFVYVINASFSNGKEISRKGNISLIR